MSVFCGLVALLLLSGSHLSHAASVLKPKECDGIKTPVEYVERLEAIFDGDERGASVCEDTLFGRTDQFWEGNELPESLSKNSLMWVFVSDSSVLNKFLDFASEECSGVDSQCDREALIVKMMNYAGFDTGTIMDSIQNDQFKNFTMVVVDKEKAKNAWNFDLGPFQPTWEKLYEYLGLPTGFTVCNNDGCEEKHMPLEFPLTLSGGPSQQPNGIKDYPALTGCGDGFTGPWTRDTCTDYGNMKEQFKKSFCGPPAFNDPCGSTRCVDIYRAGPDGAWPASDLDTLTLWTRAYFEMCMSINEWFTGLGLGYDPTNHNITGNEWLVRGDKAVPSKDLDAAYVTLWGK